MRIEVNEMPTHWKKLTSTEYLGSYAFDPGEEKTATIDYVRMEAVTGADGKKEDCIVCHFKERELKPLILNRTNCKTITKLLKTPYIENWAGKRIALVVKEVRAFGDVVDAVRVKTTLPRDTASKPIPCEMCGKNITGVGQYTPEDIAKINRERFGKALCTECSKKLKAEAEKASEAEAKTEGSNIADALRASMEA